MDDSEKRSTPFIHMFSDHMQYYLYDVNTNKIVSVTKDLYEHLCRVEKKEIVLGEEIFDETIKKIEVLSERGLLKTARVEMTEHPATHLLEYYLKHKLKHMILQVTQKCNLRCEYCVYSGEYENRIHSQKQMPLETAIKAIEYLITHSRDTENISIGFYGGEPLLAFELIKKCVEYAEISGEGRKMMYSITTNGTLLTEEIIEFLVKYKFSLVFSLDGPEEIHDKHRKYANTGRGSFQLLMENIVLIKEKYPDYYMEAVSFNTVMDPSNSFSSISNFMSNEMFEKNTISSSTISDRYTDNKIIFSNQFNVEYTYEMFKFFLQKIDWLKNQNESKLIQPYYAHLKQVRNQQKKGERDQMPFKSHHAGPCIPGVMRLFVDADGSFFPCERVSETMELFRLGNINSGIDLKKADTMLNIERLSVEKCHNCWAYNYCSVCVGSAEMKEDGTNKAGGKVCWRVKENTENMFKDFAFLEELGYNFETEMMARGAEDAKNTDISI